VKSADILNLLIGVAVLGLLITRQLQPRPVRSSFRLPLILGITKLPVAEGDLGPRTMGA
jgi:hypothetical protein